MRTEGKHAARAPGEMTQSEFVAAFGEIYEHSPWVARDTWRRCAGRGLDNVETLAVELAATVDAADRDTRLALIRAHPDLAGRAAIGGRLSAASSREQAGAGIDQCSEQEYRRFQSLNEAYKARFGFPFVMAIKGSDRHAILAAFEQRLGNDAGTEFRRAIAEIHKIAGLRLSALFGSQH